MPEEENPAQPDATSADTTAKKEFLFSKSAQYFVLDDLTGEIVRPNKKKFLVIMFSLCVFL